MDYKIERKFLTIYAILEIIFSYIFMIELFVYPAIIGSVIMALVMNTLFLRLQIKDFKKSITLEQIHQKFITTYGETKFGKTF